MPVVFIVRTELELGKILLNFELAEFLARLNNFSTTNYEEAENSAHQAGPPPLKKSGEIAALTGLASGYGSYITINGVV